jgi:hypothetical protein
VSYPASVRAMSYVALAATFSVNALRYIREAINFLRLSICSLFGASARLRLNAKKNTRNASQVIPAPKAVMTIATNDAAIVAINLKVNCAITIPVIFWVDSQSDKFRSLEIGESQALHTAGLRVSIQSLHRIRTKSSGSVLQEDYVQFLRAVHSDDQSQLYVGCSARTCDEGNCASKIVHTFLETQ